MLIGSAGVSSMERKAITRTAMRRFVRYVARDDGQPVAHDTDRLLQEILGVLKEIRDEA